MNETLRWNRQSYNEILTDGYFWRDPQEDWNEKVDENAAELFLYLRIIKVFKK